MAYRFFVMPMVLINAPGPTHLPKYLPWSYRTNDGETITHHQVTGPPLEPEPLLAGISYHFVDQGIEDVCLFTADLDAAQITLLDSKPDVDTIPANLDAQIAGALAQTKERMRLWKIPANWLDASTTWRELVRGIIAIFRIGQTLDGAGQTRLWPPGVTLNSTIASLDPTYRSLLQQAIDAAGYDRSSITGGSTMEDLMEVLTTQAAPALIPGMII